MNIELKKRIQSLAWRAGMMALATLLAVIASNISSLQIDAVWVGVLGLILGEVSKAIVNQYK